MNKNLVTALCAVALVLPPLAAHSADVFSVPLHGGDTWYFLQSGTVVNSDGNNSSWGPELLDLHIDAVNVQLLDHHADWHVLDDDDRYTGSYIAQTAAGLFRVAEGNPATDAVYRYYTDPEPWLYLTQPLDVGQTLSFAGLRRGVWSVPGGGTEAWSGTWRQSFKHLGSETVTTPLGTFDALKLEMRSVTTVDTRALFPNAFSHATWDELRWFVPGLGYVKVQGSGLDETDFDGNGSIDRWQLETQTIVAVAEPPAAWTLLAGLAMLAAVRRRLRC